MMKKKEKEIKMSSLARLTVFSQGGKYYASISFPENMDHQPPGKIFSIEREIEAGEHTKLQEEARQEARKRNIPHVINLD